MKTELIAQMAEDAQDIDDPGRYDWMLTSEELHRFAEAIVRRCADAARAEVRSALEIQDIDVEYTILAEFGIEK